MLKLKYCEAPSQPWIENLEEILSINRKFQTILIALDEFNLPKAVEKEAKAILQVMSRHGSQVRLLDLSNVHLDCPDDFGVIVRSVPLLEKLKVLDLSFAKSEHEANIAPVLLKCLRSVRISEKSDSTIFKYFTAPHITSLDLLGSFSNDFAHTMKFLKSGHHLESMELGKFAFLKFFHTESKISDLKLKKMSLLTSIFAEVVSTQVGENLDEFLKSQATTLEYLQLDWASREVLKTIFTRLKQLKILHADLQFLPADKEFYEALKPMASLEEIYSEYEFPNEVAAEGILGNCPNLAFLTVPNDMKATALLPFIAVNNPKLKKLSIHSMTAQMEPEVKFHSLSELSVFFVDNLTFVTAFIANNPSIETLNAECVVGETLNVEALKALTNQPNLKHLKFGGWFETLKKIYDVIKIDYKNLKSLELRVSYRSDMRRPTLCFEFPDDIELWDGKCEYFDRRTSSLRCRKRRR